MLLRSASSSLLHSWAAPSPDSELAAATPPHPPRAHLSPPGLSSPLPASSPSPRSSAAISRALSEGDLAGLSPVPKRKPHPLAAAPAIVPVEQEDDAEAEGDLLDPNQTPSSSLRRLLSSSGINGSFPERGSDLSVVDVCEGVSSGDGGGGGRHEGGDGGAAFGSSDSSDSSAIDAYYRSMIEADPANSLLLGNYAKFLAEIQGDVAGALKCCERAIVANPADGGVLAFYAQLVWETTMDARRAEAYFDRAVKAAPDDSYVLASYARFLWDAEEGGDDGEDGEESTSGAAEFGLPQPAVVGAASQAMAAAS